jgi:hypothetical protein
VLLALREDIIEEKPLKIDKRHEKMLSWFGEWGLENETVT